jgi:hypothetical protein
MVLEIVETYLIGGVLGFIAGIVVARFYFKSRMEMKNIGQVIEYAMIHDRISRLGSMTVILNKLVVDISDCSEEITDKLELSRNIEEDIYESKS